MSSAARRTTLVVAVLVAACASARWPDEPGVPVGPSRASNLDAGAAFMDALTARRAAQGLPAPVVAARLQIDVERIAEALQRGDLSANGARREAERWGRKAYRRDVEVSLLDCGAGVPDLPGSLVSRPSTVISYAVARFRPRSLDRDQCALVVVAVTGAVKVRLEAP